VIVQTLNRNLAFVVTKKLKSDMTNPQGLQYHKPS